MLKPHSSMMKVEMPNPATLYASTDVNSMAAPFVPGPALYVEPTLNQQVFITTTVENRWRKKEHWEKNCAAVTELSHYAQNINIQINR